VGGLAVAELASIAKKLAAASAKILNFIMNSPSGWSVSGMAGGESSKNFDE
jgi:hypothetical protein